MKRSILALFVIAGMVFSAFGCKRSGDVMATFASGKITRGEFYDWMDARRMAKDAVLKNKAMQKSELEKFAIEKLSVREAKKAGFDKSDEFQFLKSHAVRSFYAQFLAKAISAEGKFSEKAARAKIIKLTVKDYKIKDNKRESLSEEERAQAMEEQYDRAKSIISQLDKGESFEEIAKKESDDFSKRKGGDIGYIVPGMRGEEFSKAVFSLKKGAYTKEPVKEMNSVYIIRVDDVVEVNENNIDSIIDDKNQQMSLKRRLAYNATVKVQDELMKGKDVVNNIEDVTLNNPGALIYRIGKKEFTVADLNKLVAFIEAKRKTLGRATMNIDDKTKRELCKRILREEVLMREAIKRGYEKNDKFKKDLGIFMDFNLAGTYEAEKVLGTIAVSPQEVREYYEKNKEQLYSRTDHTKGKPEKTVVPFETVRQSIEYRLADMKKSEKRKAWADDLLKKENFKINENELSGK